MKFFLLKTTLSVVILCGLISFNYQNEAIDPEAFMEHVKKNSSQFKEQIINKDIHYTLLYVPVELKVIQGYQNGMLSPIEAENLLKEGNKSLKFIFQIEIPDHGRREFMTYRPDSISYDNRVKYYAFEFIRDISFKSHNGADLKIINYHFERDYGISPRGTFTLEVENPSTQKVEFTFNDKVFSKEELRIKLEVPKLPKLKKVKKWKNK